MKRKTNGNKNVNGKNCSLSLSRQVLAGKKPQKGNKKVRNFCVLSKKCSAILRRPTLYLLINALTVSLIITLFATISIYCCSFQIAITTFAIVSVAIEWM